MTKLLIVEDEWILEDLREVCGQRFEVVTARDEAEARAAMDETVDIALVDACLHTSPHDGVRLLRWIKERYPGVPVVMMSAYEDFSAVRDALNAGADYWLTKPFRLGELEPLLTNLTGR